MNIDYTRLVIAWDKESLASLNRLIGNLEARLSSLKRIRNRCIEQSPDITKPIVNLTDLMQSTLLN